MDVFEQLVADILRDEGFWVQTNYRVRLTKGDKAEIGRPSCPDWEIDILAYQPRLNIVRVIECKSYLESGGVHAAMFDPAHKHAGRFKLFNEQGLRLTVFNRLKLQLEESGLCLAGANFRLGLACGHISKFNRSKLDDIFANNGWEFLGPEWLRFRFEQMAVGGYQNNAYSLVIKLAMNSKPVLDLPDDSPFGWRADASVEVARSEIPIEF
jgi:hypothetical protein